MGKRTSFVGFLTLIVLISLLALACSKKQDADKPAQPPDSNTSSESDSLPPQESPLAGRITTQTEAGSNEPELTKGQVYNQAPPGLIIAIAYSDSPSVLIGKELLSEGDTIRGVKVVKINRDTVEFEKDGARWTQQAGETPASYWSDPNS
jgi:hypothetical protein